jgi:hypothetical protein
MPLYRSALNVEGLGFEVYRQDATLQVSFECDDDYDD